MLKKPLPSSMRRTGGRAVVIAILLASGYAAWAAQPANAPSADPAPRKHGVTLSGNQVATPDMVAGPDAQVKGDAIEPSPKPDSAAVVAVRTPPPVYPAELAKQGITGRVMLIVDVAADGSVSAVKVDRSAGDERLDAAALEAVRQWMFKPLLKNGKPMPSQVRVPIDFEMDRDHEAPVAQARAALARRASARLPDAPDWGSYGSFARSFSASWETPAAPADGC